MSQPIPQDAAAASSKVIFSGIQPSGELHLGNYLGAVKQWTVDQHLDSQTSVYMIADLHAITLPHDPAALRQRTVECVAALMACGLDPDCVTIFLQSRVRAHAELQWLLSSVVQLGELRRMTHFKEKAERDQVVASLALFSYPCLQASDILLYDTDAVPVGEDQRQHIELTRDVAQRFNHRYGQTFKVPEISMPAAGARVMDLQNPSQKMSKSVDSPLGTIYLMDSPDEIRRKMRKAVTDGESRIFVSRDKPGVTNLLGLVAAIEGVSLSAAQDRCEAMNYSAFKDHVADVIIEALAPIRDRYQALLEDNQTILDALERGSNRATEMSAPTLLRAKEALGFLA